MFSSMIDPNQFYTGAWLQWLIISHTAFLVVPALMWASDDWLHHDRFQFKSLLRMKQRVGRYPHYLFH